MQTLQHTEVQHCDVQGRDKLKDMDGEAGKKVIESLSDIAPDRGHYTLEFTVNAIDTRSRLALQSQERVTIAVLTALGNAQLPLKEHIHRALDVGCTRTEVVETILHVAVWIGFAAVLHSTLAAKEVFQERDARVNGLNHA